MQLPHVTLTESPPLLTIQCMTENVHIFITHAT
jgi:hypothetical protein